MAEQRRKAKLDADSYMKERNYRQVVLLRQQNDREQRRLENTLHCKHGIVDVHKFNMSQIEEERQRIENEAQRFHTTTTTTWGFLPPRRDKKSYQSSNSNSIFADPFEKSFAAEKMFKKASPLKNRVNRISPVHSLDGLDQDQDPAHQGLKTTSSSPGHLESIGNIDIVKSRKNIFDRLSKPKRNNEQHRLHDSLHSPMKNASWKTGPSPSPTKAIHFVANTNHSDNRLKQEFLGSTDSPDFAKARTPVLPLPPAPLKPAIVNANAHTNQNYLYNYHNPKEAVFHIVREESSDDSKSLRALFYKPPSGKSAKRNFASKISVVPHASNRQVITKAMLGQDEHKEFTFVDKNNSVHAEVSMKTAHTAKTVTYADDIVDVMPDNSNKYAYDIDNVMPDNSTKVEDTATDNDVNISKATIKFNNNNIANSIENNRSGTNDSENNSNIHGVATSNRTNVLTTSNNSQAEITDSSPSIKKPPIPPKPFKETSAAQGGVRRERTRQYSFARSSTKASSFVSGSSNSKTANKKKRIKKVAVAEGSEGDHVNPDGSLRTKSSLPDFNEMISEALNARYLRMRNPVWYEREMSVSEIWKDREKPLKQRLRLN